MEVAAPKYIDGGHFTSRPCRAISYSYVDLLACRALASNEEASRDRVQKLAGQQHHYVGLAFANDGVGLGGFRVIMPTAPVRMPASRRICSAKGTWKPDIGFIFA